MSASEERNDRGELYTDVALLTELAREYQAHVDPSRDDNAYREEHAKLLSIFRNAAETFGISKYTADAVMRAAEIEFGRPTVAPELA